LSGYVNVALQLSTLDRLRRQTEGGRERERKREQKKQQQKLKEKKRKTKRKKKNVSRFFFLHRKGTCMAA